MSLVPPALFDHVVFGIHDLQIPPNPHAEMSPKGEMLSTLTNGAIINWAARTQNIEAVFSIMTQHDFETRGIIPGSRKTLEGDILSWKVLPANISGGRDQV